MSTAIVANGVRAFKIIDRQCQARRKSSRRLTTKKRSFQCGTVPKLSAVGQFQFPIALAKLN
jgi:hypothetical protein